MAAPGSALPFGPLEAALETALRPIRQDSDPILLLFSGGIDSAFLAQALADTGRVHLWTIGVAGTAEVEVAQSAAQLLNLPWGFHAIDSAGVARAAERWDRELKGARGPSRSVVVALALAIASAPPGRIVTGQGADELFWGYAHFRGLDAEAAAERSRQDFERLDREDGPRLTRVADELGRRMESPFTHPAFRAAVATWPAAERLPGPLTKPLLRAWAGQRGLPAEIRERPKRAVQYGSGVDRLLRRVRRGAEELP